MDPGKPCYNFCIYIWRRLNVRLGIIVYSNDHEVLKNVFTLASFALEKGDKVRVFLSGKGVEAGAMSKVDAYSSDTFHTTEQMKDFIKKGGRLIASQECLGFRGLGIPDACQAGTINDLYGIVKDSDRVIAF
jgi:uncharacterized protein involved in oxidation of intracellular sulfur